MLIVPDVQDVYTPLQTDVIVPLSEVSYKYFHACRILVDKWSLENVFTLFYFPLFSIVLRLIGFLLSYLVPSTLRITSGKHSYHVPK